MSAPKEEDQPGPVEGESAMSDGPLRRSVARLEAAMSRIETAVDGLVARRAAAREASKLERAGGADGPANEALRAAQRELDRLKRENEALRAVGAAADPETLKAFESALDRVAADDDAAADAAKSGG